MQTEINQGDTSAEVITPPKESSIVSGAIAATAPGKLRVIKRNGTVVPFEASKISVAITKAFLARGNIKLPEITSSTENNSRKNVPPRSHCPPPLRPQLAISQWCRLMASAHH